MFFDSIQSFATLALIAIGHLGVGVVGYNRLNATGLKRNTIKRIEKLSALIWIAIPIVLIGTELTRLGSGPFVDSLTHVVWSNWSLLTQWYCGFVIVFAIALAPRWILDRPVFSIAHDRYRITGSKTHNYPIADESTLKQYVEGGSFRKMARLPRNEIASIDWNTKSLLYESLPPELSGLRIAHLSDIHLTAKMGVPFYRMVVEWVQSQSPDMIIVAGDIVDYEHALAQIEPVFEGLSAPMGMYFVIGNHDRRLDYPLVVCERMTKLGWIDLGQADAVVRNGSMTIRLMGNERPWFHRNSVAERERPAKDDQTPEWRIGVSHSPDQFGWGGTQACELLLCGHTHGGQIRFPFIGPIISPSWYGSRYASGVFQRNQTIMHVSRGISSVHPYRWGCMPEATILKLMNSQPTEKESIRK